MSIKNRNIHASAEIALSKLGTGTLGTGVKIVDANVDSSAAIALSKLATGALPSAITVTTANYTAASVGSAALNANLLQYADVTVTTGQLLALNATPKTLVAAPGANKAIIFEGALFFYDYNAAAYAGIHADDEFAIRYTDGSGAIVAELEATGFLDGTADDFRWVYPLAAAEITPVVNAALVLHMQNSEVTTGDSPVKVRVFYRVVDTNI